MTTATQQIEPCFELHHKSDLLPLAEEIKRTIIDLGLEFVRAKGRKAWNVTRLNGKKGRPTKAVLQDFCKRASISVLKHVSVNDIVSFIHAGAEAGKVLSSLAAGMLSPEQAFRALEALAASSVDGLLALVEAALTGGVGGPIGILVSFARCFWRSKLGQSIRKTVAKVGKKIVRKTVKTVKRAGRFFVSKVLRNVSTKLFAFRSA